MSELDRLLRLRQGTSFKVHLLTRYRDIVTIFDEPARLGDDDKTDVEWIISTPHGIATIYNYKDGRAYLGEAGLDVEQIVEWHVGAKNAKVYQYISDKVTTAIMKGFS